MGYFKDLQVGEIVVFSRSAARPWDTSSIIKLDGYGFTFKPLLYANSVAMEHQRQIIEKWKPFIVET